MTTGRDMKVGGDESAIRRLPVKVGAQLKVDGYPIHWLKDEPSFILAMTCFTVVEDPPFLVNVSHQGRSF